ncbi:unnamed protein product [Miscanthus lutarioriparius]|uniref:Uncharacterized protein n=1 Tax=Miscanthus lutarioriparius TaxID=422564 RepID=A0A811MBA5_9POAL|nr:unnamed protein product [Miscanthus lutarioriparius]
MPRSKERSSTSGSSSPRSPRLLPESKPHSAAAGLAARAATSSNPHLRAAGDLERPPPPPLYLTTMPSPRTPRSRPGGYYGICRPSLARVHAPTPSSMSSGGGGGGGDPLKSFASHYSERRQQLLDFFIEYTVSSVKTAFYKVQAASAKETGSPSFEIHFNHILEYNKELAFAIFNSQDRFNEWVYPTVYQFLTSEGIAKNVVERMKITFHTMPLSIEDFLREHGSLISIKSIFGGSFKLCVAHDIGMVLVHGFLEEIFSNHRKCRTWNGGFNISDMVVVNSTECRITKKSTRGGSHCTAKDLHRIGEIFMPMFSCNRGMALYFDVLQKDLSMASENEVKEEWFWEYLLSHPALKQSMARYYLECGLQYAAITFEGSGMPIQSILGVYSDWKALIPIELTENTPITDFSLYKVFWSKCEPTEGVDDPFAATVGGLLAYKGNFLQHGDEYVKVHDHSELEQFAAKTFPQALPNILRKLLRDCKTHMNEPLMVLWKAYHASRMGSDVNTEGRTGICISFSEEGR